MEIVEKLSSEQLIQMEDKHGAHNYHPLPVVLEKGDIIEVRRVLKHKKCFRIQVEGGKVLDIPFASRPYLKFLM